MRLEVSSLQDLPRWNLQYGSSLLFCLSATETETLRGTTLAIWIVVLRCDAGDSWRGPEMLFPLTVWPRGRQTGNRQARPDICCFGADKSCALSPAELLVPRACVAGRLLRIDSPGRCAGYFFYFFFSQPAFWLSKAAYVRLWVLGEIKQTAFKAF